MSVRSRTYEEYADLLHLCQLLRVAKTSKSAYQLLAVEIGRLLKIQLRSQIERVRSYDQRYLPRIDNSAYYKFIMRKLVKHLILTAHFGPVVRHDHGPWTLVIIAVLAPSGVPLRF